MYFKFTNVFYIFTVTRFFPLFNLLFANVFLATAGLTLSVFVVSSFTMVQDCPSSLWATLKAVINWMEPKSLAPCVMIPVIFLGDCRSTWGHRNSLFYKRSNRQTKKQCAALSCPPLLPATTQIGCCWRQSRRWSCPVCPAGRSEGARRRLRCPRCGRCWRPWSAG